MKRITITDIKQPYKNTILMGTKMYINSSTFDDALLPGMFDYGIRHRLTIYIRSN